MQRNLLLLLLSGACASPPRSVTGGSKATSCSDSAVVEPGSPPALTPERVPSAFQRPRPRDKVLLDIEALERLLQAIDPSHQDYADVLERTADACFELYLAEAAVDRTRSRAALERAAAHLAGVSPGAATQDAARLYLRGLVFEQTGALAQAKEAYTAAIRVGGQPSDMARVHYALGLHARLDGDEPRARSELARARELVRRAPPAEHERTLERAIDDLARDCASAPRRP